MELIVTLVLVTLAVVMIAIMALHARNLARQNTELYLVGVYHDDTRWALVGLFREELAAQKKAEEFDGAAFVQPLKVGEPVNLGQCYYPNVPQETSITAEQMRVIAETGEYQLRE